MPRIQLSRSVTIGIAKFIDCDFIAPFAERALGELLDISFVHQRDGFALVLQRELNRNAHQALGSGDRNRLDANAGILANLFLRARQHVVVEEVENFLRLGASPA